MNDINDDFVLKKCFISFGIPHDFVNLRFSNEVKNMILRFINFESFLTNSNFWRPQNRCFWNSHWKTLNWTKWCSFYIEINFWLGPKWPPFWVQIIPIFSKFELIWITKLYKIIANLQSDQAFLQSLNINYIIPILNNVKDVL